MQTAKIAKRHKCRHSYCPNHYDDVVGKAGWTQRDSLKGAECIPCLYAIQLSNQGTTPEKVETVPHLMEMFTKLLSDTGWTWQHVKDSYQRIQALPNDLRAEVLRS